MKSSEKNARPYVEESLDIPMQKVIDNMQEESFNSTYFGIPILKCPLDFFVYHELIYSIKPDVIVEIGNYYGGSTLALAHLLDNIGKGKLIAVDKNHSRIHESVKKHPRISMIEGDAISSFEKVKKLIKMTDKVLIIEDSSHKYNDTLEILRRYSNLVSIGSYLIVEDSIFHHGVKVGAKPGAYEAIETFIKESKNFEIDREKERFIITWNPKGYLKRKA